MVAEKKVFAVITARGGSKGIPRKNVVDCGGKPLIAWTIEAARQSELIDRLIVSTDDDEISEVAVRYGADVPFRRPSELAGDTSCHVAVVQHAVTWMEDNCGENYDYVVLIQPTCPLITPVDIDGAVKLALENDADSVITVHEARQHPYYSRRRRSDGSLDFIIPAGRTITRRQDLPEAFAEAGAVFVIKKEVLMSTGVLETEYPLAYVLPEERALDVDTPWDLHLVDLILKDLMTTG